MNRIDILLVEDNPADAELISETLQSCDLLVDMHVSVDGEEALLFLQSLLDARTDLPHLILLDLNLPRLDGREVLCHLKSNRLLQLIPVIVLSSSGSDDDVIQSYRLGANSYVTKPENLRGYLGIARAVEDFWCRVAILPPAHDYTA